MGDVVLAIDQGTTSTKALLVARDGRIVARGTAPVPIAFPAPGWVQQDGESIWRSVLDAVAACIAAARDASIVAIGVTNQRESVLMWDRATGAPLGPCITWQCSRTSETCDELRARGVADAVERKTGLTLNPLFSATKMAWLLDNIPGARARAEADELCIGTVDSWLIWRLTAGKTHATDASNASRTQLVDLDTGDWDGELLRLFRVPRVALARIHDSSGYFGECVGAGALPKGAPVAGVAGDSHAAMFGHGAFHPGAVKATFGTGTSLMTLCDGEGASSIGLSRTIAWRLKARSTLAAEGNIASSGGTKEWLAKLLNIDSAGLSEMAALSAGGVYIVPAFSGLGAPYWDDRARGLVCGLTGAAGAPELARAVLESIAYQVRDVFDAMQSVASLSTLLADGGASRDDRLMQFQADIIDCPVLRNRSTDLSALGAAWLAGLGVGLWRDLQELEAVPREIDRFEPAMERTRRDELYAGWGEAVARARLRGSVS